MIKKEIRLMLDSGAHTLYEKKVRGGQGYSYYETDEFWKYVDDYAEFVKDNKCIDIYVNVDAIFNPELSWKIQRYLEDIHNLKPLPVFHFGGDLKWLKKYMDNYDYIGIGGLGQEVTASAYIPWADRVFDLLCDFPDRLPRWKTHGFAVTSLKLMLRYPWFSVDSSTWVVHSRMGSIMLPKCRNGKEDYFQDPYIISISNRSPSLKDTGKHFDTFSSAEQEIILSYLNKKGYVLGKSDFRLVNAQSYELQNNERWIGPERGDGQRKAETIIEYGLCNDHILRDECNIIYYLSLEKAIDEKYPWPSPFKKRSSYQGLGL
jgi:hypothetical protein